MTLERSAAVVCYFPGSRGNKIQSSLNISRVEGSLNNHRLEKSPPQRVKRMRHFSSVDTERHLTSSAAVPVVPRYLVMKRKEGDFRKVSPFLTENGVNGCAESAVQEIR